MVEHQVVKKKTMIPERLLFQIGLLIIRNLWASKTSSLFRVNLVALYYSRLLSMIFEAISAITLDNV